MRYDRTVIGYHGCDESVAEQLLAGRPFRKSENTYDWLGHGIYFWEYGCDRALRFAERQRELGKIEKPAVVGALVQLGRCFDLMDTRFTSELAEAYRVFETSVRQLGHPLPENAGKTPERKARKLDCAVLNFWLAALADDDLSYDTVRCAFWEGDLVYPTAGFHQESHIQLAVRNPSCIVGVFRPILDL